MDATIGRRRRSKRLADVSLARDKQQHCLPTEPKRRFARRPQADDLEQQQKQRQKPSKREEKGKEPQINAQQLMQRQQQQRAQSILVARQPINSSLQTSANQMLLAPIGPNTANINNRQPREATANQNQQRQTEANFIKATSREHSWHWDGADKPLECLITSDDQLDVCFHPECSDSVAAIRGSKPFIRNGNYYYWEVTVFEKTYGTSMMFGVCTKQQNLRLNDYCNLIGLDQNGWSLSHKGLIWHDGKPARYTKMFPANQSVTVGLLLNTMRGELSYFLNGENLGVAFYGLNDIQEELYPVIGSTAKGTRMRLNGAYCGYVSLLERSCFTLLNNARDKIELINYLHQQQVPTNLIKYLAEVAEVRSSRILK